MNELLPIIRRVRRPLLVEESEPDGPPPPVVVGNVEPVRVEARGINLETSVEPEQTSDASDPSNAGAD